MGKYLKQFETHHDYEDYIDDDPFLPNVSICDDEPTHVHYNQYTPPPTPTPQNNEIFYTTWDGEPLHAYISISRDKIYDDVYQLEQNYDWRLINNYDSTTPNIVEHTYGKIVFDRDITQIKNYIEDLVQDDEGDINSSTNLKTITFPNSIEYINDNYLNFISFDFNQDENKLMGVTVWDTYYDTSDGLPITIPGINERNKLYIRTGM